MSTVQERREWVAKLPETEEEARRRLSDLHTFLNEGDRRFIDGIMYKWENGKHCATVFSDWLSQQNESAIHDRLEIVELFALCDVRWLRFTKGSCAATEQANFADWTHSTISDLASEWRQRRLKT